MSKKSALLILNGQLDLKAEEISTIMQKNLINKIIAVDGGANKAEKLNLLPDLIIGDLDSITTKNLNFFQEKNVEIIKFPVEKDQTDSEIAVDYCYKNGIDELYLTAGLGGRIDQELANLNLLEYIYNLNLKAKIISKNLEIALIGVQKRFKNKKGYRLSLIPQSKKILKLEIKGCKYNLNGLDIERSQSRGISNKIESDWAEIKIAQGLLFYVLEKTNV